MTTLYIAGPMSGLPDHNRPAFLDAESELVAWGYKTLNPARTDLGEPGFDPRATWENYLRAGIRQVLDADGIAVLPNWWTSRGTRLELHIAEQLEIKWMPLSSWILAASRERQEKAAAGAADRAARIYGNEGRA